MGDITVRIKAVVVQRICAHYRIPFFLGLSKSQNVQFVFAFGNSRPIDALKSCRPDGIRHIPVRNIWITPSGAWIWQSGVIRLAFKKDIDVLIVEASPYIVSSIILCFFARIMGKPVLLWGHGIGSKRGSIARMLRIILPQVLGGYIFYDRKQAAEVISWGLPKKYVFIANNALDTKAIMGLAFSWRYKTRKNILYIGRLLKEKKVDILIKAFALSIEKLPHTTNLLIIGDGPEMRVLKKVSSSICPASRIAFLGEITQNEKLAPIFGSGLITVFPGTAGLGILHSLAFGLPVLVAHDALHGPEISAVREGLTGRFFRSDDTHDLANKIVGTIEDYEALEKMSHNAQDLLKTDYSVEVMVARFEKACLSVKNSILIHDQQGRE